MSAKLRKMFEKATSRLKNNSGQGLVEYALILVLIALVVLAAVSSVGTTANNKFERINAAIRNGV